MSFIIGPFSSLFLILDQTAQADASPPQPTFDGAVGQTRRRRDVAHRAALEVERLEQPRLRSRQAIERSLKQRPSFHRRETVISGDVVRIVIAGALDSRVALVVAVEPARYGRQPRTRTIRQPCRAPRIDGAQPGLLSDILGEIEVAGAPPSDEVVQLVDRGAIDISNLVFGGRVSRTVSPVPSTQSDTNAPKNPRPASS
jgi:hypothetical protein